MMNHQEVPGVVPICDKAEFEKISTCEIDKFLKYSSIRRYNKSCL